MLAQLVALINELAGEIEAAPPRLDGLLALRGVVETVEDEDETVIEARCGEVLRSWADALDRLAAARAEEGARLAAMLRSQLDEMAALSAAAADCAAAQPAAIRERLLAVLARLTGPDAAAMPEERVAQEVALLVGALRHPRGDRSAAAPMSSRPATCCGKARRSGAGSISCARN